MAPGDSEPLPLADETFSCAGCGAPFTPKGGEATCAACLRASVGEPVARTGNDSARVSRRARPVRPELPALSDESPGRARMIGFLALSVSGLAIIAMLIAAAHWWLLLGDAWAIVAVWFCFALVALLLLLVDVSPTNPTPWERRAGLFGLIGALVAIVAFAGYPLTSGFRVLAWVAFLDVLTLSGGLLFIIGSGRRLRILAAWTGCDPDDEGFLSQSGPLLLGIFLVGSAYLMTHFFRRGLDAADAYAFAIGAWLIWRSLAVAWHALEVLSTRSMRAARDERRRERVAGRLDHQRGD